jgi:hypothetical protein
MLNRRKAIVFRSHEFPLVHRRWRLRKGDLWSPLDNGPLQVWTGFFKGWKPVSY